jgi:nitrogen fixation NifU-like protein
MSDLRDLYQEVIFDHNRHPRNYGPMPQANRHAEGFNPLCGDRLTLNLLVKDGIIQDARFEGSGCAISTASASLMTEALKGKTEAEAATLFEGFHHMVMGEPASIDLGKLAVLAGVAEFPARVKCATLAWHTLNAALKNETEPVSTE